MIKNDIYKIALGRVNGLGAKTIQTLKEKLGSAERILKTPYNKLCQVPNIGPSIAHAISSFSEFSECERELRFIENNGIICLEPEDPNYPYLLRHIPDRPYLLFQKGELDLKERRCLSVVGTRNSTRRAEKMILHLLEPLIDHNCVIVSGLAYGIDAMAHSAALELGIPTLAVLAHGLDRIYPAIHTKLVYSILNSGGALISEFQSGSKPARENFPMRNRIVAGMSEGVIVVESRLKGGSMITADLAFHYDREVMAFPGRIDDEEYAGCLELIRSNKATMIRSASDIAEVLNWDLEHKNSGQITLRLELTDNEQEIWNVLKEDSPLHLDKVKAKVSLGIGELATTMLELEIRNIIRTLPGPMYELT